MNRATIKNFHKGAGILSFLLISSFLCLSIGAELFGSHGQIIMVKQYIVSALLFVFIAMPMAALSGRKLTGKSRNQIVTRKTKRMKWIVLNGMVLTVLAIGLLIKASNMEFDILFWILQGLEFALGGINLSLLGLMIRDGIRLNAKPKSKAQLA